MKRLKIHIVYMLKAMVITMTLYFVCGILVVLFS